MAYQIGQLKDPVNNSFQPVSFTKSECINIESVVNDIQFNDWGLKGVDSNFLIPSEHYFLNFTVERYKLNQYGSSSTIDFTVYLLKSISETTYEISQTLGSFEVLPFVPSEDNPDERQYVNFELMFTPVKNDIDAIGFVMQRTPYDYSHEEGFRTMNLIINRYGIINNILPQVSGIGNRAAKKIGVQSRPGFLMCINGEPIKVGKTGIYEINCGLPVNFFGITNTEDHFIFDCAWDDSETSNNT